MPPQSRLRDKSQVPSDAHGCPSCAHACIGPAISGSANVYVNALPALRAEGADNGVHSACCGPNTWITKAGSGTVYINGKKAARKGDATTHCGGNGQIVDGSDNVWTGG